MEYIAPFNPKAAADLVERIMRAGSGLALFPNRGRAVYGGFRELASLRPYVIVYKVELDVIRILRVWHGAQDRTDGMAEEQAELTA